MNEGPEFEGPPGSDATNGHAHSAEPTIQAIQAIQAMQTAQDLVGVVAASDYRVLMVLGGRDRWRVAGGYTFLPLELPGGICPAGMDPANYAPDLARRWLGCEARVIACPASYGPSAKHRIDRLPMTEQPAPLLQVARLAPPAEDANAAEEGTMPHLGQMLVRTYLVRIEGEPRPAPESAGLLALPLAALRQAVRGMPLADLLALPKVGYVPPEHADGANPANALVYVTGEYGERHLLRAVAKYGSEVLEG